MSIIIEDFEKLEIENTISKTILNHLYEGIYFVDNDRNIKYWNKGAENITGYSAEEILGKSCNDNILCHIDENGNELCEVECPLTASIKFECYTDKRIYLKHKEGHRVPVWVRVSPINNNRNQIIGAVEIFVDDSDYEKVKYQANHDILTGLLNRRAIHDKLEQELSRSKRMEKIIGIIIIDIDHFKTVNDTYGHQIGDTVLIEVSNKIKQALRPYDEVGRYGGEEFLVILPETDFDNALMVAERIRSAIYTNRINMENKVIKLSASFGVSVICEQYENETLDEFIKTADKALYQAKDNGRNRVEGLYHPHFKCR